MRYELFIGLRYLRAKRKEAFISLITIISMLGVTLGVAVLNIALSIMTGFEEDLRKKYKVKIDDSGERTVELPGLVIGARVARELNLDVDDLISVLSPIASPTAVGMLPKYKRFVVAGIFDSGMAEYDSTLIYM